MSGLLDGWDAPSVQDPPELRPYQIEAVERIEQAYKDGKKAPVLQSACGAGKTVIGGEARACLPGKRELGPSRC